MVLLLAVVILLTFVRHDLVDDEHDPRLRWNWKRASAAQDCVR
jgi:hypothetical protein